MNGFLFVGFAPTPSERGRAERLYARLLESAPDDSAVTALLEKSADLYHCTIEIASRIYPVTVGASHRSAAMALDKAELSLLRKLERRGVRLRERSWEKFAGAV